MATSTKCHGMPNSPSLSPTKASSSLLGPNFYCQPIEAIALHRPGASQCSHKALAATTVANTPRAYQKYAWVIDKVAANKLPKHGLQDLPIGLADSNTNPLGPLHNLSTNRLKALQGYVRSILPTGAPIHFLRMKDSTLCLRVYYRGPNCIPQQAWSLSNKSQVPSRPATSP